MQRQTENKSDVSTKLSNAGKIILITGVGLGYKAGNALANLPGSNPPNYAMSTAAAMAFAMNTYWNRSLLSLLSTAYFTYAAVQQYGTEKVVAVTSNTVGSWYNGAKNYVGSFFGGNAEKAAAQTTASAEQTVEATAPALN